LMRAARWLVLLSAVLSGAAGLSIEALLLSCAGLPLGYGASTAWGLAAFPAAWALGARLAGASRASPAQLLSALGAGALSVFPLAMGVLLTAGGPQLAGGPLAACAALGAIALTGMLQGAVLPLLARIQEQARPARARLSWLWFACLLGAALGARPIAHDLVG